jgi:hypothetical protein
MYNQWKKYMHFCGLIKWVDGNLTYCMYMYIYCKYFEEIHFCGLIDQSVEIFTYYMTYMYVYIKYLELWHKFVYINIMKMN